MVFPPETQAQSDDCNQKTRARPDRIQAKSPQNENRFDGPDPYHQTSERTDIVQVESLIDRGIRAPSIILGDCIAPEYKEQRIDPRHNRNNQTDNYTHNPLLRVVGYDQNIFTINSTYFKFYEKSATMRVFMEDKLPIRINKYLAHEGLTTRREADTLIEKGAVLINGKKAVLGQMVEKGDSVELLKDKNKKYVYLAFNKPKGIVTHSPQRNEKEIKDIIKMKDVFPVGRLDKESHGLIILTNDGRITQRLLDPENRHEREYFVATKQKLRNNFKEKMAAGIQIEGYKTRPAKVSLMGENKFKIILTEGKRHQIRRMMVALFNEVTDLKRIRISNIKLDRLSPGEFRNIEGEELETFLKSLDIKN